MRLQRANAALAGWILLASFLGACGSSRACEHERGTFRVPNHNQVWHVEYEPAGNDEMLIRVKLGSGGGGGEAGLSLGSPEGWVTFGQSGRDAVYQLVIASWSDGAADIAWSQEGGEQDAPVLFNRLHLGCSDGLGYAALPGRNDQVTLFSKNDAGQWEQMAVVDLHR